MSDGRKSGPVRLRWFLAASLLTAVAVTGGLTWLVVVYPAQAGPGKGRVRAVELAPGGGVADLQRAVGAYQLVRRPRVFGLYMRVLGAGGRLRTGTVLVRDDMSPRQLLQRFGRGYGATELRITFPEGLSRFGVADRLARWGVCGRADFLSATTDADLLSDLGIQADSAEGYLFPDTYRIRDDARPAALVRRMVRHGRAQLDALLSREGDGLSRLHAELGFGRHELLTLASIVEKEAAKPDERPVIAGVFLNRLTDPTFRPKRLQADPTVAYGCTRDATLPSCERFDGRRVTRRMTSDPDNPYNTYRHAGLPPGPIANPGLLSVAAVLRPDDHRYLYFVARGAGRHTFSETLDEHNAAVRVLRRLR
ncbi:MAG: endolytic transglycosylase MltG [Myxococcales bacterium]|nr:endolytic transglycosylase MltG [Myxococcales bacterium]